MQQKVLFVINHQAGHPSKINSIDLINKHALKNNYSAVFFEISGTDIKASIIQTIDQHQPNIIAAMGGDGTVSLISSIIQKTEKILLIIPQGSANGMAKELRIPETLESCLHLITHGKVVEIDLLKVNDIFCIHLADVGLNARIVKRFQLDPKRGLITYAKHLFYELFILKIREFQIITNDEAYKLNAISLTFANATQYGTGAVINPDGILNDGWFEICIVKPFPKYKLFQIAYQMFNNKLKTNTYFEVIKCQEATIKSKKKTLLQVDGEVLNKVNTIQLSCLPKVLKVLISNKLNHPTLIN